MRRGGPRPGGVAPTCRGVTVSHGRLPTDAPPPAACVACEGDLDSDGQVNGADIARVLNDWGCAGDGCLADLDGNLRVDGADLTLVLNAWGGCGE